MGMNCSDSSECAEKLVCVVSAEFAYPFFGGEASPAMVRAGGRSHHSGARILSVPVELSPASVSKGRKGTIELADPLDMKGMFQGCSGTKLKHSCLGKCAVSVSNPPFGYYREESSMTWKVQKWAVCHPTTGVPCEAGLDCQQPHGSADHFCLPKDFKSKWDSFESLSDNMNCTGSGDLDGWTSWSGTCRRIQSDFVLRCYRNPAADQVGKDDGKCFIPRKKKCDPQSQSFLCRPGTTCSVETGKCVKY